MEFGDFKVWGSGIGWYPGALHYTLTFRQRCPSSYLYANKTHQQQHNVAVIHPVIPKTHSTITENTHVSYGAT